ncbi:hypothetical protein HAP94_26110, partial [Acidithiobacillus ferrivorans]|nr:hypothetical protein [Acidithiobacillus ferrivorans]
MSNTADVWTEISLAPQSPEGPIAAVPAESPVQIPQPIWQQEVTHPMNAEEQQAMEQIDTFLKDPKSISEVHKQQWIA